MFFYKSFASLLFNTNNDRRFPDSQEIKYENLYAQQKSAPPKGGALFDLYVS